MIVMLQRLRYMYCELEYGEGTDFYTAMEFIKRLDEEGCIATSECYREYWKGILQAAEQFHVVLTRELQVRVDKVLEMGDTIEEYW